MPQQNSALAFKLASFAQARLSSVNSIINWVEPNLEQQPVHRLLLVLLPFDQLELLPLLRLDGALLQLKLFGNGLLLAAEAERNVAAFVLKEDEQFKQPRSFA